MTAGKRLSVITNKRYRKAIGLMSGTSADGIDAVLVRVSGKGTSTRVHQLAFITYPIPAVIRRKLLAISLPGAGTTEDVCAFNFITARLFANAVMELLKLSGIKAGNVDFIGSHGQTIHHLPQVQKIGGISSASTLQIADPSVIAKLTGILTVGGFRSADIALQGQGAPLVPYFDYLTCVSEKEHRLLLNLGGIGNITALPRNCMAGNVVAFDTGPGNMLIDGAMQFFYRKPYDEAGTIGLRGAVNRVMLQYLIEHDTFINKRPPKSTGREYYGNSYLREVLHANPGVPPADAVATLTYFTAYAVHANYRKFLRKSIPDGTLLVSGGGAHNTAILRHLTTLFNGSIHIKPFSSKNYTSDAKEAVCFAVLANETLHGLPANLPKVTGAGHSTILGSICLP